MRLKGGLIVEESQNILWRQPFNLKRSSPTPCAGEILITPTTITLMEDGEETCSFPLEGLSDFFVKQEVGSGFFAAKCEKGDFLICRFDMSLFATFGELAKGMNYYLRTGVFPQVEKVKHLCEHCHRPIEPGGTCPYCTKKGHLLLRFFKMFRHYLPSFAATIAITLAVQSLWIIFPYVQRLVIDNYVTPMNAEPIGFCLTVGCMVLVQVFITIGSRINAKFSNKVSVGVGRDLRSMLFAKVESLSLSSVSRRTPGELINRLTGDTERIQMFIADNGPEVVLRVMTFLVLGVILFVTDWQLALWVVAPFPLVFWLVSKLQLRIHFLYTELWRKYDKNNDALHDILSGIRVVKSFGSEDREIENYRKSSKNYTEALERAEVYWSYRMPFINFLISMGTYIAIYFGARLVITPDSNFTVGTLMQFTSYAATFYMPLYWLMWLRRSMTQVSVSASKILEILDEKENVLDLSDDSKLEIKGEVEFKNVGFGYKKYESVLKDVSFKVNPGEMIGIVGHSGVGKSTLINLLLHLYDISEGQIFIDGQDTSTISQLALRREIGVVLQETFLFYGSVYDNIRYSKPDATLEEVIRAAKIANAHSFIINLPDGYNTRVGDRGYGLSGGERQRIAIARAILHNPSIIILDEATASLDTKTDKEIQDALNRVTEGRTTFAIAHRLSTLQEADRLLVLDGGTVAEMGTHMELMQKKGVYYELVMAQRQTARIRH